MKEDWTKYNLSVHTINTLRNKEINTIEDLFKWSDNELLKIKGFGRKALEEIRTLKRMLETKNYGVTDIFKPITISKLQYDVARQAIINVVDELCRIKGLKLSGKVYADSYLPLDN